MGDCGGLAGVAGRAATAAAAEFEDEADEEADAADAADAKSRVRDCLRSRGGGNTTVTTSDFWLTVVWEGSGDVSM